MVSPYLNKAFSIVELLIASSLGIIVILAVLSVYIHTTEDSRNLVRQVQFSEEMNALVQIISNDIKRAGYWAGAKDLNHISENPYAEWIVSDHQSIYFPFSINLHQQGECISLAYDSKDDDGVTIQADDLFAYRLKDKQIQTLTSAKLINFKSDPCANNAGRWMSLSDKQFMEIKQFQFSVADSQCLNMTTNLIEKAVAPSIEFPCVHIEKNPHDRLVEMRFLSLLFSAKLKTKAKIDTEKLIIEKSVKTMVPNHLMFQYLEVDE